MSYFLLFHKLMPKNKPKALISGPFRPFQTIGFAFLNAIFILFLVKSYILDKKAEKYYFGRSGFTYFVYNLSEVLFDWSKNNNSRYGPSGLAGFFICVLKIN